MLRNRLEPRLLAALATAAAAAVVFIKVADEVIEGETHAIDTAIILLLRHVGDPSTPIGPVWLQDFARDLTALGSSGILALFVLAAAIFLLLVGRPRMALYAVATTAGGALITTVLKDAFNRPRPDFFAPGVHAVSASFPSGHAMGSAVVYLTLAALVARIAPEPRLKLYVLGVATMLSAMVGVSRIYLGVHWPSDVLAGWAAGAAWAVACWMVAQFVERNIKDRR